MANVDNPNVVQIFDTTLRDGEQSPGASMTAEQKVIIARQLEKLGAESVVTPSGWLGFSFIFFLLAVSVFCCMQISSVRGEEAEQRLETLLALPVGRRGWLAGRLLLAAAGRPR